MPSLAAWLAIVALAASAVAFDPVSPAYVPRLPQDAGSHPGHRIEWWYATGQVESPRGPLGFQVTFFRVRNPAAEGNASRFAPSQLLFAHAAIADPQAGRLRHDQRSARALAGLVEAQVGETRVVIDDWSLVREAGAYRARIPADGFALELTLTPTQPVLLQGERGFSRKGPRPEHASHYYSEPHLAVAGTITIGRDALPVRGTAWLDHEWSSAALPEGATGWDWVGANLAGGEALMAFRMRGAGGATLWTAATRRRVGQDPETFSGNQVRFQTVREWRSPRTGTAYPVAFDLSVGGDAWRVEPLMDDQELDARASTGTLYWEGAVRLSNPSGRGGNGYLELTGYNGRPPF